MTSPTVEPHILCDNLVRIYTTEGVEVQALQGLDLRIDPGELVALVGQSGSGKSTLLGILSGLDTPTGGHAQVAGMDLLTMSAKQRVHFQRHVVGFVWQQTSRNLLPYLTVAENLAVPLALAGDKNRKGRVDELIDLLHLGDCAAKHPREISGGQQQRAAIGVALANNPAVVLADEPTGELDEEMSVDVLESLRMASDDLGVTVLIVTHDPTVSEHVRRTVRIRHGRTSTETLRRTSTNADGEHEAVAEEFAVIDRVGRLQLPEDFVTTLDLKDRVRLALEEDHVGVWPGDSTRKPAAQDEEGEAR